MGTLNFGVNYIYVCTYAHLYTYTYTYMYTHAIVLYVCKMCIMCIYLEPKDI